MARNRTLPTAVDVKTFLNAVDHHTRRADGLVLDALFRSITGWQPRMWGGTMVGYGQYRYVYDSGREGDFLATGFSPRKANLSIYIMPGYQDFGSLLKDLGKHKIGKSCLYINKLADVDQAVLARLIRAGLDDLGKRWPVQPT